MQTADTRTAPVQRIAMREGLLAEFTRPEQLVAALRALRERGYRRLDAYTPYPVSEAELTVKPGRSRLPVLVFLVGMAAAAGAYALQWFLDAYLYPLDVGGRPPHMPLPFMIITFEMGVLFAGFAAFLGALAAAGATRLWDPVFEVEGFERASIDRFFLEVERSDAHFDESRTAAELTELGALRVARFGGRET
jgi:hypothetical protein